MTKRIQNVTEKEGRGGDGDLGIASVGMRVEEKKLDTVPEGREGERLRDQKRLGEPGVQGTEMDEQGRAEDSEKKQKKQWKQGGGTSMKSQPMHSSTPSPTHLTHNTHFTHTPAEHTSLTHTHTPHAHHMYTQQSPHTHRTCLHAPRTPALTHMITLTPMPDTLVGSACDPETPVRSRRRAMIDVYK